MGRGDASPSLPLTAPQSSTGAGVAASCSFLEGRRKGVRGNSAGPPSAKGAARRHCSASLVMTPSERRHLQDDGGARGRQPPFSEGRASGPSDRRRRAATEGTPPNASSKRNVSRTIGGAKKGVVGLGKTLSIRSPPEPDGGSARLEAFNKMARIRFADPCDKHAERQGAPSPCWSRGLDARGEQNPRVWSSVT